MRSQSEFPKIIRNTSIIGASQILVILILIIKAKLTAILIGPIGMGLVYALTNVTGLIGTISNFGLGTIAIKNISKVNTLGNGFLLARMVRTYWCLAFLTGTIGLLLVIVLSSYLSEVAFDNSEYANTFIIISITLLLAQINTGQFTVLPSLNKFKEFAISNIVSGIVILLFTVVIFYTYGLKGVAATIVTSSLIPPIVNYYYIRKIKIFKVKLKLRRIINYGYELLNLGTSISLTRIMPLVSTLVLNAFIVRVGGIGEVGLYNAGFVIMFGYTGVIFKAMEPEYFSRLSAESQKSLSSGVPVNQQIEIAMLLIAPLIMGILFLTEISLLLLYSADFLVLTDMVKLGMLGLFLKALTWPLPYVFLVKNDSKLYFLNELFFNLMFLVCSIFFYFHYGIIGLGYSFFLASIANTIFLISTLKIKYRFSINKENKRIFAYHGLLLCLGFVVNKSISFKFSWFFELILISSSLAISYYYLSKRLNFRELILHKIPFFK